MTDVELEKKANESYAKQLKDSSYYETGEEGAYICGYIAGAKEVENEYMLKLKDTSLVRALKDSIIMNEKLSSQEQQELCAWIEAAMEFGENLDECAKENEKLKLINKKLRCCKNCKKYRMLESQVPLSCLKNRRINSCCEDWEMDE